MTVREDEAPPGLNCRPVLKLSAWWARGSTLSALSVVVFLGIWQLVTSTGLIEPIFLASPLAIAKVAYEQFLSPGTSTRIFW